MRRARSRRRSTTRTRRSRSRRPTAGSRRPPRSRTSTSATATTRAASRRSCAAAARSRRARPGTTTPADITGTITPADVIGPASQGINPGDWQKLVDAMRAGVTYANVHSQKFPAGEIRGQINNDNQREPAVNGPGGGSRRLPLGAGCGQPRAGFERPQHPFELRRSSNCGGARGARRGSRAVFFTSRSPSVPA